MAKSPRFDPDTLDVLVTIADTRSFTETAKILGRSQSTISASIRRLEETTGRRLVNRTTRSVILTSDGEEMVRYARMVADLSEDTMRRMSQPGCSDTVRLGVFTNFDGMFLTTALREFARVHPSIQVKVETHRSDMLLSRFKDGALDIVLATRQPGHGFGAPLWNDDLVWVGLNEIPTSRREPIPLAVRVRPSMLRRAGVEALHVARRPHVVVFESNAYPSIAAAVAAGLGIGVFTRAIRPPDLPVIEPGVLPHLGSIDFVLLKTDDRRDVVEALYSILRDGSPDLFATAGASIFGASSMRRPHDEIIGRTPQQGTGLGA